MMFAVARLDADIRERGSQKKKEEGDVGRAMVASEELGMVTRFRLAAFTIHASDEAAAGYSASERERLGTRFETSKRI